MRTLWMASAAAFLLLNFSGAVRGGEQAPPERAKVEALIKQLGDEQFEQRQKATQALLDMGEKILPAVEQAAKQKLGPEARMRLKEIAYRIGLAAARRKSGVSSAKTFLKALGRGEPREFGGFYAEKIVLKAGSELLKPSWGFATSRDKDVVMLRAKLLKGLATLIGKAGRDRWTGIFSKVNEKRIWISTAKVKDKPFQGVRAGDTVLRVQLKPSLDDRLTWIFRRSVKGE